MALNLGLCLTFLVYEGLLSCGAQSLAHMYQSALNHARPSAPGRVEALETPQVEGILGPNFISTPLKGRWVLFKWLL